MGIPFYFKSMISRFPDIIKTSHMRCNNLYLDFNCVIHMCAARLLPLAHTFPDFNTQVLVSPKPDLNFTARGS